MNTVFLIYALALPCDTRSDYAHLRAFLEKKEPGYFVVYVNPDEKLLGDDALDTGINIVVPGRKDLRVWRVRKSA